MHILLKILFSSLLLSSFVLGDLVLSEPSRSQAFLSLIPLGSTVILATVVFMAIAQPDTVQRWLNLAPNLPSDDLSGLKLKLGVAGLLFLGIWSFVVGAVLATLRM
jgi:hypothetical protein